jgi:anti-sigma factor RsiW
VTCRELVEFLMAYLDGELPEGQRAAFEEHLRLCPPCEVYLRTYEDTIRLGKGACRVEEELAEDAPDDLVRAILAARER